jgi:hypothetical protein
MCLGGACVEREEVKKKETREMFLSTSYDKEIRPMGSLVIQPCLGNQKKEEKNVKWRKGGENIVFNKFAARVANFQRVNWMSNVHW